MSHDVCSQTERDKLSSVLNDVTIQCVNTLICISWCINIPVYTDLIAIDTAKLVESRRLSLSAVSLTERSVNKRTREKCPMRGEACETTAHLTLDMWITASMHIIRKHQQPPTYQSISEYSQCSHSQWIDASVNVSNKLWGLRYICD